MDWKITGRHPLGVTRTSADGRYEIFSSKPGTGHMLAYPGDPLRHVVKRVHDDHVQIMHPRWHKLSQAQVFTEIDNERW